MNRELVSMFLLRLYWMFLSIFISFLSLVRRTTQTPTASSPAAKTTSLVLISIPVFTRFKADDGIKHSLKY